MNCTTCRYELSQCLDGRLPSGRRAIVLQHASSCDACGTFWEELQAAQKLTLRLQRPGVSANFRESLWQRIQAGEGTPDAVFHEPVPLLAKVRYALTGAAAAAAALLCVTLLRPKDAPPTPTIAKLEARKTEPVESSPRPTTTVSTAALGANSRFHQEAPPIDEMPLLSSTQRLRFNLVAVEMARQLDQRYAEATTALRRLSLNGNDAALEQVLENAGEFHTFGELLLDMADRKQLLFNDAEIEPDLRLAVTMLSRSQRLDRSLQTVEGIVAPAFRSTRLASVARTIAPVQLDPSEETEVLRHLNTQRPEIFPKLFIVFGNNDLAQQMGWMNSESLFLMDDDCGPSWVAPRSVVEARTGFLQQMRRVGYAGGKVEIEVIKPAK